MRPSPPRVGWLCSYTPIEILVAAGVQPVRLRGGAGNEVLARAYLPAAICPYLKGCLGNALAGNAEGIDGVVMVNCCDGMRRLADLWSRYLPGFVYLLDLPRHRDAAAVSYFRSRLEALVRFLVDRYGQPLDGDALPAAIRSLNETRRHLAALDRLRQRGSDLPASRMLDLVESSTGEAPDEVNPRLAELVARGIPSRSSQAVPVVVSGNLVAPDDRGVFDLIQDAGGRVVGDDLCNGMRGMKVQIEEDGDSLQALARGYLSRAPCSRMAFFEERLDEVARLCRETGAQGVLYLSQKFCDASLYDFASMRTRLQKDGVSSLLLELDATANAVGQLRTRIEAFLEAL